MPTGTWPEMVWLVNIDFRIDCPEGGRTRLREVAMSMEHERRRIGRRTFLWGAAASAGAVAIGGALAGIPGALAGKPGGTAPRNALYIPPTVTPSSYTLTAAPPPPGPRAGERGRGKGGHTALPGAGRPGPGGRGV